MSDLIVDKTENLTREQINEWLSSQITHQKSTLYFLDEVFDWWNQNDPNDLYDTEKELYEEGTDMKNTIIKNINDLTKLVDYDKYYGRHITDGLVKVFGEDEGRQMYEDTFPNGHTEKLKYRFSELLLEEERLRYLKGERGGIPKSDKKILDKNVLPSIVRTDKKEVK